MEFEQALHHIVKFKKAYSLIRKLSIFSFCSDATTGILVL